MKLAIVMVAALVVLGGAGGAGWWFFLREPPAEEAGSETGAAAEAGKGKKKDILRQATFDLEPFILPILREGQVTEHLTLILRLEFHEPQTRPYFKEFAPQLRDAFFSELHGLYAFRHVQARGEGLPVVRERLAAAGDRVFGPGMVKTVLVKAASRRVPDEG